MTDNEWEKSTDLDRMLKFLRDRTSDRKLRLLACASYRYVGNLLDDDRYWAAVENAEAYADGEVTVESLIDVREQVRTLPKQTPRYYTRLCADQLLSPSAFGTSWAVVRSVQCVQMADLRDKSTLRGDSLELWLASKSITCMEAVAAILRHVVGNPFRPCPAMMPFPTTVVQLAQSLYDGQDCAFALHDALLDAGLTEFAEHFRQESWHPKGCWALDCLLGKR